MAKSIRSKIKKRFRTAKRQRVAEMVDKPRNIANNRMCAKIAEGLPFDKKKKRNGFLYPNDATAKIPKICVVKPVDFRSSHLPMAGYAFKGNRRKYNTEEKAVLLAKSRDHPKMARLAGGALPDVFRSEEELAAEERGESVVDEQQPGMAMMMEGKEDPMTGKDETMKDEDDEEDEEDEAVPEDGVDTARKPVKKNLRKQHQNPKKKETLSLKKKTKQQRQDKIK